MQIIDLPIDEVTPYENNPRNNEAAVKAVAASIREFGFKVPIVIDRDGVIIAGHTRHKAALQLGLETVPTIRADDLTIKALTHDAYYRNCHSLINKEAITEDESDNHDYMWQAYKAQKLNGTGKKLHEQIIQKPVVPNTD